MLNVQNYLLKHQSFCRLECEFDIKPNVHHTLPLVILNYSQINSPKTDPIVRECRGLVLNAQDYSLVAKSFTRFFNWGEALPNPFDWSNFTANEKMDGSIILVYNFAGEWRVNTRNSFGEGCHGGTSVSYRDMVFSLLDVDPLDGHEEKTFTFELIGPYNPHVRRYATNQLKLLTVFDGENELSTHQSDKLAAELNIHRPQTYQFSGLEQILDFLAHKAKTDKTFEGVVIRDKDNNRYKLKSKSYLALHHLLDNNNIHRADRLVPLILTGEIDETLTYFPDTIPVAKEYKRIIDEEYLRLAALWEEVKGIDGQKEFARSIIGRTKFTGLLFNLRKSNPPKTLQEMWVSSPDMILNNLF